MAALTVSFGLTNSHIHFPIRSCCTQIHIELVPSGKSKQSRDVMVKVLSLDEVEAPRFPATLKPPAHLIRIRLILLLNFLSICETAVLHLLLQFPPRSRTARRVGLLKVVAHVTLTSEVVRFGEVLLPWCSYSTTYVDTYVQP